MGRCAQSTFIGRSDWQSIYPAPLDMTAEWFIILLDHSAANPPSGPLPSWHSKKPPRSKLPVVYLSRQPLTNLPSLSAAGMYVWATRRMSERKPERVKASGRWKGINKNQAGMKRGKIYVGVHPCSAWLSPDWRETLAPLIQCLSRDNKSAWAQIEERQSLSCTVVSGPGVQRLLSQTLTYNVWFKKCNLTNIQHKCTVKGRQVIDPL